MALKRTGAVVFFLLLSQQVFSAGAAPTREDLEKQGKIQRKDKHELQSTNWPNVNDITETDDERQDSPCEIIPVTSDPPTSTTETTTPTPPTPSPDLDTVRDPPPPDVLHPSVRPGLPDNRLTFPYYPVNGGPSAHGQGGAAGGGQLPHHSQSGGHGFPPAPKWFFHPQGGAGLPLGWFPQGVPFYGGLNPGHPLWAHGWSLVLRGRSSEESSD